MKKTLLILLTFSVFTIFSQNKEVQWETVNLSINDGGTNLGPSFFGKNIVFSSASGGRLHLFKGPLVDNNVKSKKSFLKADTNESNAVFTKDLKTMYYTRSLYGEENTTKYSKDKRPVIAIFKATRASDGTWANITPLPFNSEKYDVGHPALSNDGKKLYFSSNMSRSIGKSDIYVVDILGDNKFSEPKNLGKTINTTGNELYPFISKNNVLYFSSNGHKSYGGLDIYSIDLAQPNAEVKHLTKPINSSYDDFSFIYDPTKKIGLFSSNRTKGKGNDDIYLLKEKEEEEDEKVVKKGECSQKLIGTVYKIATQKRIANALVKLKDDNEKVVKEFSTTENAKFNFQLKCGKKYKIESSKNGYKTSERLIITNAVDKVIIKKNLFLTTKLPKGKKQEFLYVGTVDFDYNEWVLQKRFMYELDKAIRLMKENKNLYIEFESHTDSRAPADFNMELSEKRIEVLNEYIGFQGIFRKRFSGKAYGETKPINRCVKGVECTEEEYLANRRTIFVLKEKKK